MKTFTYTYQGQVFNASTDHYLVEGSKKYRISFGDEQCTIIPSEIPGHGGSTVWLQQTQIADKILPEELLQALGEGLHDAESI